ncbi:hypothetical protein NJBCHELONAE_01780 [Mycobacteroides chelonae]|uniref:hypothetical protein n=1 Tax=Mycobacteroides chelonae TaxID=1774 RepID=UPI0021DF249C|nr:hypothetical protein [Mycobacteroides chelonae]GLE54867.1 hypothetical protein NJBCHELONAE_01780 [Mycobacteroides chelonae]
MTAAQGRGYDGYSMSNNARAAYDDGAVPLSGMTAGWVKAHGIGCTAATLKVLIAENEVTTTEYHHTSTRYNTTEFYRPEAVKAQVERLGSDRISDIVAAAKARKQRESAGTVHRNCHVEWLEWGGTRNRPTAEEMHAEGATVAVKGQTATITLAGGRTFTKRLSTNGFRFETAAARKDRVVGERRREREVAAYWRDLTARFKAAANGTKFESTSYFTWRDAADRDSSVVTWTPITHTEILTALRESGGQYAIRTIERLESGERDVIRVGLHLGIRRKEARL